MKPTLTPREKQIVRLISLGCSNKEAGRILGLSPYTIDNHRSALKEKFATDKAALLTRLAIKHRFTKVNDKLTAAEKRKSGRRADGWN